MLGPNGVGAVVFTGGSLVLGPDAPGADGVYFRTAQRVMQRVKASSGIVPGEASPIKPDRIAIHGTCMGFQVLMILLANDTSILSTYAFDSEDLSLPLDLTPEAATSRFLSSLPATDYDALSRWNITSNLHHDGVHPKHFAAGGALAGKADLLSTNVDRKGQPFASTAEATDDRLRLSANQWHPERPQFEWRPEMGVNHSAASVRANGAVADFVVEGARASLQAGRVMGSSNATASLARELSTLTMTRATAGDNDPAAAVVALFFDSPARYRD
jgi:gamma-glutamyl hydrolase